MTVFLWILLTLPAAEAKWQRVKGEGKADYTSIELGGRLMAHYNRKIVLSTPPETMLAELHYTYWYRGSVGGYLTIAKSLAGSDTLVLGAGLRLPFLSFFQDDTSVGKLQLLMVADFVRYDTAAPVLPQSFPEVSWVVRGGGGVQWYVAKTPLYIQASGMVSQISNNFFIAPYLGAGVSF